MTLNITLPTEIEHAIRERAIAAGLDVETFVANVVKEEVADDVAWTKQPRLSHAEFVTKLRAMIERHGIRNGKFDDSRESIYEGCGE